MPRKIRGRWIPANHRPRMPLVRAIRLEHDTGVAARVPGGFTTRIRTIWLPARLV
jgi:hypothetical protein